MFEDSVDGSLQCLALQEVTGLIHSFGVRRSDGIARSCPVVTLRQVHSDRCVVANDPEGSYPEGDALVANVPGHVLAVRTADCLPILMASHDERVVAAIHAGWRGTVSRIAAKTIEKLRQEFGAAPKGLVVAIGPGIQRCCFEVGPEVAAEFQEIFPERDDLDTRTYLDLVEANRRQILEMGVAAENLYVSGVCTVCHGDQFHSYRRDRDRAGRMISAIGLLPI